MKKKLMLLSLSSVLLLTACGSGDDKKESSSGSEEKTEKVDKKKEKKDEKDRKLEIGKEMDFGDFKMTITDFSVGTDYDGNDALIITYNWENTSEDEKSASPFMTFIIKGFQDGVETDDAFMVDGVNLESGQKEIQAGGKIEGAQSAIGITDMDKEMEIRVTPAFSFEDTEFKTVIVPSEL